MIDPNDTLYSIIIRSQAHGRCRRCHTHVGFHRLECAHIFGRTHKLTRFLLEPKYNAIALCRECHTWFDANKEMDLIFDASLRTKKPSEESFTWLVGSESHIAFPWEHMKYTWADLYEIYSIGHHQVGKYGKLEKAEVKARLKTYIKTHLPNEGERRNV